MNGTNKIRQLKGLPPFQYLRETCCKSLDLLKTQSTTLVIYKGVKILTRLRVKFSSLNEHRFLHNVECLSPACICGAAREDTEPCLLHCPQFCTLCQTLLGQISDDGFDIANMSTKELCSCMVS